MPKTDFVDYVVSDLFAGWPGVRTRAMFGGHGVYKDEAMFGIIDDDVLYFKVGEANRRAYEEAGSRPFSYRAKNRKKAVVMSFWEVPAEVMDDRDAIRRWAEAAVRASRQKATR
jgi:DNA transformation protein